MQMAEKRHGPKESRVCQPQRAAGREKERKKEERKTLDVCGWSDAKGEIIVQ